MEESESIIVDRPVFKEYATIYRRYPVKMNFPVRKEERRKREKVEKERDGFKELALEWARKYVKAEIELEEIKEKHEKEINLPSGLLERGLVGYGAGEKEKVMGRITGVGRDMFASYHKLAQQPTMIEPKKEIFENILQSFDDKLKTGGKLSSDDLNQLIEIDRFAEEHNLLELHEKVAKIIVSLEKTIPAEEVELKEGEIKELDEDTLVRKRKNGVIELIIL